MQGILVILVLVSGVGVKFNTEQFVNCGYNASSKSLKLPTAVGVNPLCLGINYLMNEETSPLQEDLNSSISSNSRIARKTTKVDYVVEGIGGVVGGMGLSLPLVYWPLTEGIEPTSVIGIFTIQAKLMYLAAGGFIALPIGSALGTTIFGKIRGENGSFWKALAGAYFGVAFAFGSRLLFSDSPSFPKYTTGAVIVSIGAVIGYNL